jgi:crotonobetainyl-CoA:carnitine CoA-transferase CaiB-like acyl-CoA transferase
MPDSNRSQSPRMAPHGIYPARGDDEWVAIACRDQRDFEALARVSGAAFVRDPRFATPRGRLEHEDALDRAMGEWTRGRDKFELASELQDAAVPAAAVQRPGERIDRDANTAAWGLWPEVEHGAMGKVRVDGLPVHLSETDWELARGGPCLGEHNERILCGLLGLSRGELAKLREEGVI